VSHQELIDELKESERRMRRGSMAADRDPERIGPVMLLLWETWDRYPTMRLGQLIAAVAGCNQFYMEDSALAENLLHFLGEK